MSDTMASFLADGALVFVTAAAAYLATRLAFKGEVAQAEKDRQAKKDGEAAKKIVADVIRLASLYRDALYAKPSVKWDEDAYTTRTSLLAGIKTKALSLSSPCKERVTHAVEVIHDADELHHFHYAGPHSIIVTAEGDAVRCLAALDAHNPLPRRPMLMIELEQSQAELGEMRFEGHEHEEEEFLARQQKWWRAHPDTVALLRRVGHEVKVDQAPDEAGG